MLTFVLWLWPQWDIDSWPLYRKDSENRTKEEKELPYSEENTKAQDSPNNPEEKNK